jgi:hypothetical protein
VIPVFKPVAIASLSLNLTGAWIVGKYFVGWILGVPVFVLVIIYLLFN